MTEQTFGFVILFQTKLEKANHFLPSEIKSLHTSMRVISIVNNVYVRYL